MTAYARLAQGPSNHPRPWIILVEYQGEHPDAYLRLEFIRRDGTELTPEDCEAIRTSDNDYVINPLPDLAEAPPWSSLVSMRVKDEVPPWFNNIAFRDFETKEDALLLASRCEIQLVDKLPREVVSLV